MNENELLAAIIGQLKQINANSLSSNLTGNILWVDAVNGTVNGAAGNANKPFLTLAQAKAAASSGDLVWVRPGNYTVTDTILKDQVNWYFSAGASVSRTTTGVSGTGLIDDNNVAVTSTIYGQGDFSLTLDSTNINYRGCVQSSNASSNITVSARTILTTQDNGAVGAPVGVYGAAGTLRVRASVSIGAVDNSTAIDSGIGVYWVHGLTIAEAPSIYGSNNAVWIASTGTAVENLYVSAQEIYTTGSTNANAQDGVIFSFGSTNANAAVWIRAGTIKANAGTGNIVLFSDSTSSSKIYVQAQKLWGEAIVGGGLVYIDADKVEALSNVTGATTALFVECSGGTLRYNVRQHDPKAFTGSAFLIDGGTFISNQIEYTSGSGSNGLNISSGTARIQTAYLNTAANNAGNPATISGGTLILHVSTLVAEAGRDSITAGTAQNVICTGSWANKAVNGNVTVIITGGLSVDADVA